MATNVATVMVNRDRPTPLPVQLAAVLRAEIAGGRLTGKLPSEPDLAAAYGVSRRTVRAALAILIADGLVVRHARRGTFVAP